MKARSIETTYGQVAVSRSALSRLAIAVVMLALSFAITFGPSAPAYAYDEATPFNGGQTTVNLQMITHTLTIDPNGGTGTATSQTYVDGYSLEAPECTYTHATKGFAYWTVDSDGLTMAIYPGDTVLITNDVTLYAQYSDSAPRPSIDVPASGLPVAPWSVLVGVCLVLGAIGAALSIRDSKRKSGEGR